MQHGARTRSPERRPSHQDHRRDSDDATDYKALYHIAIANNAKRDKRKHAESDTSVQRQGRGIRKVAALFGETVHIIAQAQAYQKGLIPDGDSIDPYSKDTTDAQHEWLEKKRKQVHDFTRNATTTYVVIDRLMPGLINTLAKLSRSQKADYFTLVQKGANDARSDDFRRVTRCMAQWINEDSSSDKPDLKMFDHTPPITRTNEETAYPTQSAIVEDCSPADIGTSTGPRMASCLGAGADTQTAAGAPALTRPIPQALGLVVLAFRPLPASGQASHRLPPVQDAAGASCIPSLNPHLIPILLLVVPPVAVAIMSNRSNRGADHDITGGLLTSTKMDWNNPETRDEIRSSATVGSNYFFPVFYQGFQGDPRKVVPGFLKSRYVARGIGSAKSALYLETFFSEKSATSLIRYHHHLPLPTMTFAVAMGQGETGAG
ncbi:hypothetical protein B0H13DRAFT_2674708 [Mycena leptocephala]|nr:hypothetical protein B0H13DRAFT_2674708 [Mycena leptocephala]